MEGNGNWGDLSTSGGKQRFDANNGACEVNDPASCTSLSLLMPPEPKQNWNLSGLKDGFVIISGTVIIVVTLFVYFLFTLSVNLQFLSTYVKGIRIIITLTHILK